ncbi:MAG: MFS transporter [Chloroflexi bacterium]|nr:MFS transporter [Chloroflexota bacterium]
MSESPGESLIAESYASEQQVKFKIPSVVRRNTVLLALSQAFVGSGTQMITALGALAVLQVTGSAVWAGLSTASAAISRFAVSYPAGKISDRFGRKPVLVLGNVFGMIGAVLTGLAIVRGSFPLLVAAFLVFGLGMGATQQIRVAAADMYPPSRRGLGLGYVLTGSLVGVLIAPGVIALAQRLSPRVGIDPLGLPWLFVPILVLPAMFLVFAIRPDPQNIAMNLEKHYPGYQPLPRTAPGAQPRPSPVAFLHHYPRLVAVVSSLAVQGNMAMMMFLTSLALHQHDYQLAAISASVSLHVVGMTGFSMPLGWLADRLGRRAVLLAGVVIAGTGSMLVPSSTSYWVITTGTFLVGLGWSAGYVAATALIADTSSPEERGRAVGSNDTVSYLPGIILPLVAGPMVAGIGFRSVGILGLCLMVPPFLLLMRLREPSPGKYAWGARTIAGRASR